MLTVFLTSPPGVTRGIAAIVKLIEDNYDNLIDVIRISKKLEGGKTLSFTYIALFREKNSLGDFVAFINEEGTNWGTESGGEGRRGHALIESFLEDKEIGVKEVDLDEIDVDIRDQLPEKSVYDRCKVWERYLISEHISSSFFWETTSYEVNSRWSDMLNKWMD